MRTHRSTSQRAALLAIDVFLSHYRQAVETDAGCCARHEARCCLRGDNVGAPKGDGASGIPWGTHLLRFRIMAWDRGSLGVRHTRNVRTHSRLTRWNVGRVMARPNSAYCDSSIVPPAWSRCGSKSNAMIPDQQRIFQLHLTAGTAYKHLFPSYTLEDALRELNKTSHTLWRESSA